MGSTSLTTAAVCAVAAAALLCTMPPLQAQGARGLADIVPRSLNELRMQDARVDRMRRGGDLRIRESREDRLVPGRRIERADQYHRGVRVFGGDVARQFAGAQTVSVFGTVYDGLTVNTNPLISEIDARRRVEDRAGVRLGPSRAGELVVLPHEAGRPTLAWRSRAATGDDVRE